MINGKCYDYALKYLYRFPKSEKELKVQLLKKGFSEIEVEKAIDILKKQKFIDDENFTKLYINSELIKKGKPVYLIKGKLISKGIDKKIIEKTINDLSEDIDEGVQMKIKKQIETYKSKGIDGFTIIQKLTQKGYKLYDIKKVIDEIS